MDSSLHRHFPLRRDRVHEVYGAGSNALAFAAAGQDSLLWVRAAWQLESLNPLGFQDFVDPQQVLTAKCDNHVDVLATAEEALRSGVVKLVVIDTSQAISFTACRRLQLAAKTGRATGLCLIQDGMGSNASETRWECTPLFDPEDSTLQRWELKKNKSGTLGAWNVRWSTSSRRIHVVSEARL